jgi:hypothetical protein
MAQIHCKKRLAVFLFPAGMPLTFFYSVRVLHIFLQWFEPVEQQPAGEGRGLPGPGHQQAGLCSGSLHHALIRTPLEQSATPVIRTPLEQRATPAIRTPLDQSANPVIRDSSRSDCYSGHLGLL